MKAEYLGETSVLLIQGKEYQVLGREGIFLWIFDGIGKSFLPQSWFEIKE